MLEKICPVHNVPVYGDKCIKDGCEARPLVSTTIYWCEHCKVPVFEKDVIRVVENVPIWQQI